MALGTSPKRVLLAEDDAPVHISLRRLLQRAGWVVVEAENGTEALQLLRTTPVDVVLTDLYMPDLDGIELIAAARAMLPGIPIVAMSGDSPERFAALLDASLLGVVVTLQKPFTSATMLAALSRACACAGAEGGAGGPPG